jgi:long-chain acyl-CoA synthetase
MINTFSFLDAAARNRGTAPFLATDAGLQTFGEVHAQAAAFAGVLVERGVSCGDRVVLMLSNTSTLVASLYGTFMAGGVAVPIDIQAPVPEVAHALNEVGAILLVCEAPVAAVGIEGARQAPTCRQVLVTGTGEVPTGGERLESFLSKADPLRDAAYTRPHDPAALLFTSGTTGRPKAAILTHFNLYMISGILARDFWKIGSDDVVLMVAPNAHIFGQALIHTACMAGARLRLVPRFDPTSCLRAIGQEGVTFVAGVPALGYFLLKAAETSGEAMRSLRTIMLGGDYVAPALISALEERLGVTVLTGYGMTEAVPVTYAAAGDPCPSHAAGKAAWGTSLRIVNESGQEVPVGESGEIVFRGPQVSPGYFGRTHENDAHSAEGWFHSGDVGRLDKNGYLYVLGRIKTIIKTGGYSVFPAEVERVLKMHPDVVDAAVLGRPHRTLGEVVTAFVVARQDSALKEQVLNRHCRAHLAPQKCPRSIALLDSLPRTRSGKLDRQALVEFALM